MSTASSMHPPGWVGMQILFEEASRVVKLQGDVARLLDYPADALLGGEVTLVELIHHDDQDLLQQMIAAPVSEQPALFNLRLRRRHGGIICVRVSYRKSSSDQLELDLQDARKLPRTLDDITSVPHLRAIMDNTDSYIYFKDRNHVFVGASQTLVELCEPAEHWRDLLGFTDYDFFPETLADNYYRLEKRVFAGAPVAKEIQQTLNKAGNRGWVDNRKYPIHNPSGEIIGLYGIARDITQQVRDRASLEYERDFNQRILKTVNSFIILLDLDGTIQWVNRRCAEVLGWHETPAKTDLNHIVEFDQQEISIDWIKRRIKLAEPGHSVGGKLRLPGEQYRLVDWHFSAILDDQQQDSGILITGNDTTREIELTRRLEKISNHVPGMIYQYQQWPDGRTAFPYSSAGIRQIFGVDPADVEQDASPAFAVLHPDDFDQVVNSIAQSMQNLTQWHNDYRIKLDDGRVIWAEGESTPEPQSDGSVLWHGHIRDVTERVQARQQLEENSKLLEETQRIARIGSFKFSFAIDHWDSSPQLDKMLGIDSDYPHTLASWFELIHPEERDTMRAYLRTEIMQAGSAFNRECRIVRHDNGQVRWMLGTGEALLDASGETVGMIGSVQDITEKKHYEQALKDSEERFTLAMKGSHDGLFDWNVATNEVYYSPRYKAMLGYRDEELENKFSSWQQLVDAQGMEQARAMMDAYMAGERDDYNLEFRMRHKQGHWVDVLSRAFLVRDKDGKPIRVVGTHVDITQRKQMETQLLSFKNLLEQSSDAIFVIRYEDGRVLDANAAAYQSLGRQRDELLQMHVWEFSARMGSLEVWTQLLPKLLEQRNHNFESTHCHAKGHTFPVEISLRKVQEPSEQFFIAIARDISSRKAAENALRASEQNYRSLVNEIGDKFIVFRQDLSGAILYISNGVKQIIDDKIEPDRVPAWQSIARWTDDSIEKYQTALQYLVTGGGDSEQLEMTFSQQYDKLRKTLKVSLQVVANDQGQPIYIDGLAEDITESKKYQLELENLAHFDPLTGLPNRVLLSDRLHQAMAETRRRGQLLAVVYLDLDGFKEVNDIYGHDVGDQLLVQASQRFKQALREDDTLARIGGDEFVAILQGLDEHQSSIPFLQRLIESAQQPIAVGQHELIISSSLGVTFFPQDGDIEPDQLIRQADQAMYLAKQEGKNRYHLFDIKYDHALKIQYQEIKRIQLALERHEFLMYYQPKVNMRSGDVVGMEALIRWQHPERGLLTPNHFLPVIGKHHLAIDLGDWVLETVLKQVKTWKKQGLSLPVSINVDPTQLAQRDFVDKLKAGLARHPDVQPHDIELEVLESAAVEDIEHIGRIVRECSSLGVRFAIDDFGTGYSTLSYLKQLPTDFLKIDKSFVHDMERDPDDLAILAGIVSMSSAFRRRVIAEGVESVRQGKMLIALGCQIAQGYAIARPMPAGQVGDWVQAFRPLDEWANTSPVEILDQSVLFAMVEHRNWLFEIGECVEGRRGDCPQMNPEQCRFGEWLKQRGMQFEQHPNYAEIRQVHDLIHHQANQLLARAPRVKSAQRITDYREIEETSEHLVRLMETLLR